MKAYDSVRKQLATIISFACVISLLTGCGGNTGTNSSTTPTDSSVSSSANEITSSADEVKIDVKKIIGSDNTRAKVEFGSYWVEDSNGDGKRDKNDKKQPILWQIIDVDEDGNALLFADKILDEKPFNTERVDVTWETCSLRKWLNSNEEGGFLKEAFTESEKGFIKETLVKASDGVASNYNRDTKEVTEVPISGGNDTRDKIFIMSKQEMTDPKYKWPDEEGNPYGANVMRSAGGRYWLRTPGDRDRLMAYVVEDGKDLGILASGYWIMGSPTNGVDYDYGVRPALNINLKEAGLVEKIKYEQSIDAFKDYKGGMKAREAEQERIDSEPVESKKIVKFGKYEQDNDYSNGMETIEWMVLEEDTDNNKILIVSKYGLECRPYNTEFVATSWETCTLRAWLNNEFLNTAFDKNEQESISETTVVAERNPKTPDISAGNDTKDRLFLLSVSETEKYFPSNRSRRCAVTKLAEAQKAFVDFDSPSYNTVDGERGGIWWLRTPGTGWLSDPSYGKKWASSVSGGNFENLAQVNRGGIVVRPAMWIDLEKANIDY